MSENTDPNYVYTAEDTLYIQLTFATSVLYFCIMGSTKLSILLMYNRIFKVNKTFRYELIVASALDICWWMGCSVANLANCVPIDWTWLNTLDDPRYCFNFDIFWMATGVCELLLDIIILALPVRAVLSLQLSARKKATVACMFLLGGL